MKAVTHSNAIWCIILESLGKNLQSLFRAQFSNIHLMYMDVYDAKSGRVWLNIPPVDLGRFPFNINHWFKFSEFSLVKWNASDRFPEFKVTCPATSRNAG